tara:strand:- start:525 stop:2375 length:1851 start_codon:yes stop_codon:yes gene_type:complete
MASEGENTNTRYDLTEDEELIVHELATTQLVDERPKMRSFQENLKRGQFEYWEELYIELDGKCDTLKDLQCNFKNNIDVHDVTKLCVPIIHEIKKLPEGKTRVFEYYIERDNMKCTHLTVASIFNNITQGSYIRKQCKPDSKGHMKVLIYRYNSETQLWDNTTDLKTHFIHTMKLYCALLCQKRVNDIPLNKDTFEENYTEKDKDEKGIYLKRLKMYCNFMECNSHINAIIDIFKSLVTVEDTLLDLEPEYDKYICFRNGIYNLDTSEFRRRDISDRFTESLDWDYGKHYNYACYGVISEFFTKLQPDLEQRTFTVSFLKYCLRGGNPQAMFKMNIGYTARNGKTSEMKIFQTAFPMYTETLHKSIFNVGCPKFHKYAYKLVTRPIRLAIINELDDSKLDGELLKNFADDETELGVEEMYGTMCENQRIQCKLITTSNKDPNVTIDEGVFSRFKMQKYESRFVSAEEIDETKHWYLVDPTWVKTRLSQDSYKLAFFHFLLNEGITPVKTPKANICLVKEQLEENDEFIPKLEQYFKVTGDHNDRIAALELRKYFCGEHNDKMSVLTLNGHFKRLTAKLGIKYDKDGSVNSTRKVYRGLRKYTESERFEMEGGENPE